MTFEMLLAIFMGVFDAALAVFLVWLVVHGRREVRRIDAEFAARRREEETQRGH